MDDELRPEHERIFAIFTEPVETRVQRGADWLTDVHPGWEHKVDLSRLDMTRGCLCIAGQVLGNGEAIHLADGEVITGFSLVTQLAYALDEPYWTLQHGLIARSTREYPELEAAWVRLIKDRVVNAPLA